MKSTLNSEQRQAITHELGPLLIIAGAGTGKTTVITERIKHLIIERKIPPQEILALTFTEKASREMEERVDQALPYGVTQLWISTFHSFCDRILRNEGVQIGLNPGYRLMTEAETIMFLRKNIFKFTLEYFRPLGNPNKFVSGMIQHFSRLKDEDITPQQYMAWINKKEENSSDEFQEEGFGEEIQKYRELANAYRTYEDLKFTEGLFDYADLISQTLRLFRERPNVLQMYQQQFKYILIDEFQDTNYAQNQMAILLAGKNKNITVVGDDDQAIYRWRGAALSNMIQFRIHFPETEIVVLTKNYRSTKEILDRSYALVQYNNPDRLEVAEKIDKKLESMRRIHGDPIGFLYADRVENEAEEIVKKIKEIITQKDSVGQPYQWKDIALLVRANNHAQPFTRAFERAGIPYQFLGPGQLLRQPEVKDLIAYLILLSQIDETIAFYRVLTMKWLDLDVRDVASLVAYAKRQGLSLYEVCEGIRQQTLPDLTLYNEETFPKITEFMSMIERHLSLIRKESAGQILYYFLEDTGLLTQLTNYKTERDEQIAQNIAKFFDRIKTYEADHEDTSVFAIVEWINLSLELGESPTASNNDWTQNNAINILTLHSSKGLEFPVVFLVNLVASRFPSIERKEQIPIPDELIHEILPTGDYHLQEERRLFYVGMTRAKDHLFLTAAKYYGDGKREKKLSPFVAESIGLEEVSVIQSQPKGETKQLSLLDWAPKDPETHEVHVAKKDNTTVRYLSYSQIDTFLTCPLQYKYRYVIKLPVPQSAALSFGDTIHKTMETFYGEVKKGQKPTVDDLLHIYTGQWRSVGYGEKSYEAKMKAHGEELLREYYELGYEEGKVPRSLEDSFKLKITPTLTIGGKVDRVDQLADGKIEIIDYKTGKAPKTRDVRKDLQLTVYAMAATDQGVYAYRPEDVIVSFYFFEGQQKVTGTRTKEQLEEARDIIIKTAQDIAVSDFKPTPGKQCDFCEFRLICEAWQ